MKMEFAKYEKLNFVDVGCYNCGWINVFKALASLNGPQKEMFTIAIDPIKQTLAENPELGTEPLHDEYDVFLEKAIHQFPGKYPFYRYIQSEQNGSLRKMNPDGITFDKKDKDKFFINQAELGTLGAEHQQYETIEEMTKIKGVTEVECVTLQSVFEEYISPEIIHFLKIDTQGTDIETFFSLGEDAIKNNCLFVQLECAMSKSEAAQMYMGGSIFTQDNAFMESQGYMLVNLRNYHKYVSEADAVFMNMGLVR